MGALERLRARLASITTDIRSINEVVEAESRDALNPDETTRYEALASERADVEARIAQLEEEETRRQAIADATRQIGDTGPAARTGGRDLIYERGSGQSYFLDLIKSSTHRGSEEGFAAEERLQAHAEMLARVPANDLPAAFRAGPAKRAAGSAVNGAEVRTNPTRVGGQGGYFVPPVWLIDEFVPYLRAGRVLADRWSQMDLPAGTDSINLPKLTLGTLVGTQADGGAVTSQDITDTFVTAPVRTIAGQEDIALQLLEQSPVGGGFDEVMLKDLLASYNQQLDIQCISGTGTNSALKGIANISGINAVTYTDGTPLPYKLYQPLGQAVSQIARQRFDVPTAIVMTPQRWYWLATGLDSQNRPLVLPTGAQRFNAMASNNPDAVQGLVGDVGLGVDVYVDPNIPSNVSGNQDTIYVAKFDDLYLFEGALRTRVLVEVLSGTLQVRVQLYNYVAALVDRFPVSVSAINGTGLVAPAGF